MENNRFHCGSNMREQRYYHQCCDSGGKDMVKIGQGGKGWSAQSQPVQLLHWFTWRAEVEESTWITRETERGTAENVSLNLNTAVHQMLLIPSQVRLIQLRGDSWPKTQPVYRMKNRWACTCKGTFASKTHEWRKTKRHQISLTEQTTGACRDTSAQKHCLHEYCSALSLTKPTWDGILSLTVPDHVLLQHYSNVCFWVVVVNYM